MNWKVVVMMLVTAVAVATLSLGATPAPSAEAREPADSADALEPQDVCDGADSSLEVSDDLSADHAGRPVWAPPRKVPFRFTELRFPVPDGFRQAVARPPRRFS